MNRRTTVLAGTFALLVAANAGHAQASRPRTASMPAPAQPREAPSRPRQDNPPPPVAAPQPDGRTHTPRIGWIVSAPAAPQSPPAQTVFGAPPVYVVPAYGTVSGYGSGSGYYGGAVYGAPAQPMQLYYIPTVVLNDGRVLANFGTGRGYEQVLRQCPSFTGTLPPNFAVAPCFVVDAYGRYSVLQQR
jgi:hypothetical protein